MTSLAVESLDTKYAIHPVNDKVVIRRAPQKQSPSGLALPDNMKGNNILEGEIVAAGPGAIVMGNSKDRHTLQVHAGDKVLFNKHAGTEIEINGEKLTVMHENEIMVVLTVKKN